MVNFDRSTKINKNEKFLKFETLFLENKLWRQRFSVTSKDISCFVSNKQGTCVTLSPNGFLSDITTF